MYKYSPVDLLLMSYLLVLFLMLNFWLITHTFVGHFHPPKLRLLFGASIPFSMLTGSNHFNSDVQGQSIIYVEY